LDSDALCSVLKFADDTKIFMRVNDLSDAMVLQSDLSGLLRWTGDWQMRFNVGKCKVMHMGHGNGQFKYFMESRELEVVNAEKDLGVWISDDLKVSTQCSKAYSMASRSLGMINRTIMCKTPRILLALYKTLVRPHLEYCTAAWSPHYVKDKVLLERIQHRFTRMVPGLRHLDYMERLRRLGLWTLEERRNRADVLEVFKMLRGLSSVPFGEFFEVDASGRTRGHSVKLVRHHCRLDVRQHFFSERVINRWNRLDQTAVESRTLNAFKTNLTRLRDNEMGLFMDVCPLGLEANPWSDSSRLGAAAPGK
jgi:ribonucleases P/MRP protein subunit RPP40